MDWETSRKSWAQGEVQTDRRVRRGGSLASAVSRQVTAVFMLLYGRAHSRSLWSWWLATRFRLFPVLGAKAGTGPGRASSGLCVKCGVAGGLPFWEEEVQDWLQLEGLERQ